jgi:hypothetical protein
MPTLKTPEWYSQKLEKKVAEKPGVKIRIIVIFH